MKKSNEVRQTGTHIRAKWEAKLLALVLAVVLAVGSPLMSVASRAEEQNSQQNQQTEQTADTGSEASSGEEQQAEPSAPSVKEEPAESPAPSATEKAAEPSSPSVKEEPQKSSADSGKKDEKKEDGKESADKDEDKDEEEENPWADLMSIRELCALPVTTADATIEYKGKDAAAVNARGWAANIYYTNQTDPKNSHSVEFSDDFSLKYLLQFESSKDYAPRTVELRVPLSLVKTKDGKEIAPDAIGVPRFTEGRAQKSHKTFFNYEIDSKEGEIVFFNYTEIPAHTISAWQVSYQNIDISEVEDGASWSFLPEVTVKNGAKEEHLNDGELLPVEGVISAGEEPSEQPAEPEQPADPSGDEEGKEDTAETGDLKDLPEGEAGAVKTDEDVKLRALKKVLSQLRGEGNSHSDFWTYKIYYVNQGNSNHVYKTDNFGLKYQMEFDNSANIEANKAIITIPNTVDNCMIQYGHTPKEGGGGEAKKVVHPAEIGIPMGTPDDPVVTRKSSFNYYIDDDGNYVFFNYEDIPANSKNAWQVLYRNIDVMYIEDGYEWSVMPDVQVTLQGQEEPQHLDEDEIQPLTGEVDTYVQLQTVTKKPYSSGRSYTPGLYTEKQVKEYAPGAEKMLIPGTNEKLFDHFDEYYYVVWDVGVRGYATQPWNLDIAEALYQYNQYDSNCEGFFLNLPYQEEDEGYTDTEYRAETYSKNRSVSRSFKVVSAYPKNSVTTQGSYPSVLVNEVRARLHGYDDGYEQEGYASANWTYVDYHWIYKGDTVGVTKSGGGTLNSWLTVDEHLEENESLPTTNFSVAGTCRNFFMTHYPTSGEGYRMGDYIPGTYTKITTTDDFVYAYPKGASSAAPYYVLGKEDYFFNKVSVSISDSGYDVYEDEPAQPVDAGQTGALDRGLHVYAMFGLNEDGTVNENDVWEPVATVPWDAGGQIGYTFTAAQIARQPWRVKIEHNAVDYEARSSIETGISIKGSSPAFEQFRRDAVEVDLENIGGIAGERFDSEGSQGYIHERYIKDGNYGEPELAQRTLDLWRVLLMRDNATARLKRESRSAHACKAGTLKNDQANSRAKIRYRMEASEGYLVYSSAAIPYLKEMESTPSPHRKEVVFYDLLPFGVQFDPSGKVNAGRLSQPSDSSSGVQEESSWDKTQVSVTVDPKTDVVQNYRGTGRTLVKFHVIYSGRDSTKFNYGQWYSGFGVAFDAYCEYENYNEASEQPNIVAYMPANDSDGHPIEIVGTESQVSKDDGVVVSSDGFKEYYRPLGQDINQDGITESRNVLYGQSNVFSDIALATQAAATKLVRAESDPFGVYNPSTVVKPGELYEYKMTANNIDGVSSLKDVVFFDRLERSVYDRQIEKENGVFDDSITEDGSFDIWTGTFVSVSTGELEALKIQPVVYYSADPNAMQPSTQDPQHPSEILTSANGWIKASEWTQDLSEVKAVAIDASTMADGSDYALPAMDSISVSIFMRAPAEMPETAEWTYNYPSFYSYNTGTNVPGFTSGNSTKLRIAEASRLELEKEVDEDTPEARKDDRFRFYLTWKAGGKENVFSYKQYELYQKNAAGDWVLQPGLHSTDAAGALYLTRRQKAVFNGIDAEKIVIREEESMRWRLEDPELTGEVDEDGTRTVLALNHYRPIVYIKKNVEGYPAADTTAINEKPFRMRLTDADGEPVANTVIFVVKRALTNGEEPEVIANAEHKLYGALETPANPPEGVRVLKTDENGVFDIYPGEVVAFRADKMNVNYTVTEAEDCYGDDTDWICTKPSVTNKVTDKGAVFELTNRYQWKDLRITKSVTDAGSSDLSDTEFTFKLYKANEDGTKGEQITAFKWQLTDGGSETEDTWNQPAEDGSITAACAGKTILVRNDPQNRQFKANHQIIVEEVLAGELTESFENATGDVTVTLPSFASAGEAAFVNKWLYRDLEVSKEVIRADQGADISGKSFTMVLETAADKDAEYAPAAGAAYTLYDADGHRIYNYEDGQTTEPVEGKEEVALATDENGQFTIKADQTARFTALARVGALWRIREKADPACPPVTPALDRRTVSETDPGYSEYLEGVFGDDNSARFINGDGVLVIRKHWTGDDEASRQMINDPNSSIYNSSSYFISLWNPWIRVDADIPLRVVTSYKAEYHTNYGYQNPNVDYSEGSYSTYEYGDYIHFMAQDAYIILQPDYNAMDSGSYDFSSMEYTLTEMNPQYSFRQRSSYSPTVQAFTVNPGVDEMTVTSTPAETPEAVFDNHVVSTACTIQKRVMGGSVPKGKELVWRVEKYENGKWVPAKDVDYTVASDTYNRLSVEYSPGYSYYSPVYHSHPVKGEKGTTGADGTIRLVTTEEFYPLEIVDDIPNYSGGYPQHHIHSSVAYVIFDRDIKVNLYEGMQEGDYRVVEVPEASDSEWGTQYAFTTTPVFSDTMPYYYNSGDHADAVRYDYNMSPSPSPDAATGFINTLKTARLTIEKVVDQPTDQVFTFTLEQYKYLLSDDELAPGSGLPYTVYDKETGEVVRTGTTTSAGKLTLQGGQYAEIEVPQGTRWRATEDNAWPYYVRAIATEQKYNNVSQLKLDQVAKESPDKEYEFTLTQTADSNGNETNQPGAGLSYRVVDSEGHERTGVTDEEGRLILKGGETAFVTTPEKTTWKVSRVLTTEGSSADMSLVGDKDSLKHSDMIRRDFGAAVAQLYNASGLSMPLTRIVFGKTSDYPGKATGKSAIMDTKAFGTIRGYLHQEGDGLTCYILSDDLMYTNTDSSDMFRFEPGYSSNFFGSVQEIDFDNVSTAKTTNMSNMFDNCYNLSALNGEEGFDTSRVTDMSNMFAGCSSLSSVGVSNWDTGSVTDMSGMFSGSSLSSIDVSRWDTGSVTSMYYMFAYCYNLTNLIGEENWDTGQVTDMGYMFSGATVLPSVDAASWDVSHVNSMSNMFNNCDGITTLDLSGWDLSNVTSLSNMFYSAGNSTSILKLDGWVLGASPNLYDFLYYATFDEIDMNNWKVSGSIYFYYNYFMYNLSANTVNMNNWDLGSTSGLDTIFYYTRAKEINARNWKVPNVSSVYNLAAYSGIVSLDLSGWQFGIGRLTNMSSMLYQATSLKTADITGWDVSRVSNTYRMCYYDTNLEYLYCASDMTGQYISNSQGMWYYTTSLPHYDTSSTASGQQYAKPKSAGGNFSVH